MLDLKRLRRFLNKEYRDEYLDTTVRAGISFQIGALRAKEGQTQTAFAKRIGKPQSVVSRLESSEYGKVTVQTLLDIAKALDIGLVVRFVDYPTFFRSADRMAPAALAVDDIGESLRRGEAHINPKWNERLAQGERGNEVLPEKKVASPTPPVSHQVDQAANSGVRGRSAYEALVGY